MKLRLLLFFLMSSGMLFAQQPYQSLIITEARMESKPNTYFEITNMGNESIQLNEFKFGRHAPWDPAIEDLYNDPWGVDDNYFFLPERILEPGETFVIAGAYDFGPRKYSNKVTGFEGDQRPRQIDIYDLADLLIHYSEPKGDATDSVTRDVGGKGGNPLIIEGWHGRETWFLEHHFAEGDSAVVDQINGVFDNNGQNTNWPDAPGAGYNVAGVAMASRIANLVRKYSVTTGNLDFANARGVGNDDSEWIPLVRPNGYDNWRSVWWTVGNHGPYVLDENTLESDVIDVDFAGKTLTVPWGVGRLDDIMNYFEKKPGVAWDYHLNENQEDSIYRSAKTGDMLTIKVAGNELQTATFDIIVSEPTADANTVVPIAHLNVESVWEGGAIVTNTQSGILGWPRVTKHDHGTDTITGSWHGLPNALRTDSLMKYLEKPANATWEFVFVDDVVRPDLKDGDKLKVTSENGTVKEYHLQVQPYSPNHNGYLASITWPDIPEFYKGIFGWMGDTVPNFNPTTYNYRVQVPLDVDGMPALIAKPQNLNAKVDVQRATSLSGTTEDRTVSFIVTAEDDSVTNTYNVELIKEKDPSKIQPYLADPFLSEYVFADQWGNFVAEIVNPGNQVLDLSNYMFVHNWTPDANNAIEWGGGEDEYASRYRKYIPGYKWVTESMWAIQPATLEQDLSVNPFVQPGDVFVIGVINEIAHSNPDWIPNFKWHLPDQLDVQFRNLNETIKNPWNENIAGDLTAAGWWGGNWYLFKITNDSIKLGLKPANDPNDFELVDALGMNDGTNWNVDGSKLINDVSNIMRKPHIYEGNDVMQGSFGSTPEESEWTWTDRAYWVARNVGWPMEILNVANDIGQHFMEEPTHYKSTVTSVVYKVSEGYSMEEDIRGVVTGTSVADFLGNVNKADEGQTLTVMSGDADLGMDDLITLNDVLVVLSADSTNTTQYTLDVSDEGLSSNAVLTSSIYEIIIETQPKSAADEHENDGAGVVRGMEYGTQLRTVVDNIDVPAGASMTVIDGNGAYVSEKKLNFDTAYVNVTVNSDMYFDVVAEDGITRIVYQIQPNSSEEDAFILSDVYSVSQSTNLVNFVPRGTNVTTLLSNITPSLNATVMVVDKMGHERTEGILYDDDKIVVTSPNGMVTRTYHLGMLRTLYIRDVGYLAYVLSDVYNVDQVDYGIEGPTNETSVDDFYARITPSMGATAVVVGADGNEKTSGMLAQGDRVKVTSADGKIEVMYDIMVSVVSSNLPGVAQIEIYPNPTNGKLNVRGVESGNRIQVYTSTGAMIRDLKVQSSLETLSLDGQPSGIYLVVVSKNNKELLGRFKVSKK